MRIVALVLLGTLVACAGQIAPEDSNQTASRQKADDASSDQAKEAKEAARDDTPAAQGDAVAEYSESACWSYGAPAEGECTVGQAELCDGYYDNTSSSSGSPAPYCKRVCVNDNGKAVWSEKSHDETCPLFDSPYHLDKPGCSCDDYLEAKEKAWHGSSTPLVLSFDDAPVTFTTNAGGAFDIVADGQCHGSDWPSAATPWLALDRDGNGSIDDGSELFGSAVVLADGTRAKNGFEALRELDTNHDGIFDANDDAFTKVVVWTDRDGDRRSTPRELTSLADAGVRAISLADTRAERCDARGNCEGERSPLTTTTGKRGAVIDVYLRTR